MTVILPEEELHRARVIELNPPWMVFGFFFQRWLVSWG